MDMTVYHSCIVWNKSYLPYLLVITPVSFVFHFQDSVIQYKYYTKRLKYFSLRLGSTILRVVSCHYLMHDSKTLAQAL